MPEAAVTLRRMDGDRAAFVPLLLEADESEPVLRSYLDEGDLYELLAADTPVGVVLLIPVEPGALEIKNIALHAGHRRLGFGRAAIAAIAAHARTGGTERLLVGTADSSIGTIAFYRTCGFTDAGRIEGFFDRYPEPVIEDGVQAHDMVLFEMAL
jgi:ribosomal protein S18 acetylase RimI-like enzyme